MSDLIQIGIDVRANIKQATADLDKMGGSVVNNIRTIDRLKSEVKQLNNALSKGSATEAAYARGMRQINNELSLFQQRAAKAAQVERKFGTAAATGGKSMNRFNVALQQGGFQLQDFAVQLQSGTSFFTAFGQQGSQFAGIFGPKGAVIGAVIAVGSALGGMAAKTLMAGKELRDFGEQMDDLSKTLKDYESVTNRIADQKALSKEFGELAENAKSILEALRELKSISLKEMLGEFGSLGEIKLEKVTFRDLSNKEGFLGLLGLNTKELEVFGAKQIKKAADFLQLADTELNYGEQASEAQKYLKLVMAIQKAEDLEGRVGPAKELSGYLREMVKTREFDADKLKEIQSLQEILLSITKAQADIDKPEREAKNEAEEEYQKRLARTRVIMGQLVAERKAAAKAEAEEDRLANIETLANAERELFKANAAYEKKQRELDAAGDLAILKNKARTELELSRANAAYEKKVAKEKAAQAALDAAGDLAIIENQANRELELSRANDAYEKLSDDERQKRLDELNDKIQEMAERLAIPFAAALDLIRQAKKEAEIGLDAFGGAGSFKYGGSQKFDGEAAFEANARREAELKSINDVIAALREQTDQETKLLGLTGERRTEEEIFYQLVQENAKADIKASKDKLRAIAKEIAAQKKANASFEKLIDITGELSDAFGDYVANGLKDFSSFTDTIKSMFKKLLSDMVSMAIRNKILIPIATGVAAGFGSAAAGASMGQYATGGAQAGTIGATLATGASNFGSAALHTMTGGTYGSVAAGSTMASIGAAVPYILAAVAVIGLFTKKTKLLDSGIRTTIEGFDVAIETFKKTQTSRLFGLLKGSKKTAYEAASAEVADPLIEAIGNMQQSIVDAAGTLGIGANAFDDFSYQFKLSLKGLTEEEQLQKINEEITKMGDSFASLTGHFETMNELLEAANQRMQLQNRLDQLLGNNQAILTRQREAELKAMHELNRPLAQAIYDLEDAQAAVAQANQVVANSFAALRASIDAEKERIQDSFVSVLDGLKERLDVVNEALDQSRNIYDMLSNALSSRQVSGEAAFAGRRSSALSFLRGGDFSDERRLENALDVIAEPSEDLFSSFIDYARDFARTSITLEEAKKVAQVQLTADEKQVLLLEEQIVASEANRDAQLDALDQQYQTMVDQYNALLGIDTSVKSVGEAIGTLRSAIESLASAQAASAQAAAKAAAVGSGGSSAGVQSASAAGAKVLEKLGQSGIATRASDGAQFKRINIRGSDQLLEVAKSLGIQTSGQTGAQLSQAISNAGNLGVNVDNATRAKQFAMGGYHTGGLRMVGERGPELEATGPSRIFSHNQTSGMFRDPDLKEAVNELRREVSGLRGEQRQMQATNAKYVKRNYDINRKWDVDGLPATRT